MQLIKRRCESHGFSDIENHDNIVNEKGEKTSAFKCINWTKYVSHEKTQFFEYSICEVFTENAFPCRVKAVHVVNAPLLFNSVYKIAYPFLSKKIQDRILFHSNKDEWKSLHQSIPADVLPEQYNGKIKNEALINGLENREKLDQKFRNLLVFGCSKTKQRRHSMLKKLIRSSE
ncbi:hypothetical protein AVEN_142941-1 [Araneus ventricosus]|uniref:CRAL-TRIO domain-containing protein n=1 Tax=Araneus ventricosus TaxID=182803 RepID=A0A4Y2RIS9_ARAVE|nr:hypothetical protein AVEN_142941-1 [Araneus ventricosus]